MIGPGSDLWACVAGSFICLFRQSLLRTYCVLDPTASTVDIAVYSVQSLLLIEPTFLWGAGNRNQTHNYTRDKFNEKLGNHFEENNKGAMRTCDMEAKPHLQRP